jgi:hypothetical protein
MLFTLHPSSCRRWAGRSHPRPWVDPFAFRDYGIVSSLSRDLDGRYLRGPIDRYGSLAFGGVRTTLTCRKVSIGSATATIEPEVPFLDISGSRSIRVLWRVGVVDNPACFVLISPWLPEVVVLEVAACESVSLDPREARALHTLVEPSSLCSGPSPRFLP